MVTTIRVPDEVYQKIKKEAKKKGLTFNAYLLGLMWEVLERKKNL